MPYLKKVMDAFSDPKVRLIVLKWGTQLGKSETILNCLGWVIDESLGPVLIVYDSEKTYKRFSTTRIQPMIEACPVLRAKKHPNPDKFKIEEMHFQDCIVYLASAQNPGALASLPIEYLFCDELGKYPKFSGKEGDPVQLAMERQKTFPYTRKTVLVSSPTTSDGAISRYFESCEEKLCYFVPCPHCGSYQVLKFEQVKWELPEGVDSSDPVAQKYARETAYYECETCKKPIRDKHKPKMLAKGKWLRFDGSPRAESVESIGFWISSLYSPFITFGQVAAKFLEVKDDPPRLMTFVNGWLAEEWEDVAVQKKDPVKLLETHRTSLPPLTVPRDTLCLTMGIDTQANGFWYVVRAWLRDRTSYLVDFGFVPSFEELERVIFERAYPIEDTNERMSVWRAAIDTGGTALDGGLSMTEAVYYWLRQNSRGIVFGIKGLSQRSGKRVKRTVLDKMPSGKPLPGGLTLFLIDTIAFKEAIHYRLSLEPGSPGSFLLHSETPEEYVKQLLSEEKRIDTKTGKEKWVRVYKQNHALDCEVYAMATVDTEWFGGLEVLKRPQGILGQQKAKTPQRPRRRYNSWLNVGGFKKWL